MCFMALVGGSNDISENRHWCRIILVKISKIRSGKRTKRLPPQPHRTPTYPTGAPGNLRISSSLGMWWGVTLHHSTTLLWRERPRVFCQLPGCSWRGCKPIQSTHTSVNSLISLSSICPPLSHDSSLSKNLRLKYKDEKKSKKEVLPFLLVLLFSNSKFWAQARSHFFRSLSLFWTSLCPSC